MILLVEADITINLSRDLEIIRANRKKLQAALELFEDGVAAVRAQLRGNQAMCKHPNRTTYNDPRESGWNCPDCGESK